MTSTDANATSAPAVPEKPEATDNPCCTDGGQAPASLAEVLASLGIDPTDPRLVFDENGNLVS